MFVVGAVVAYSAGSVRGLLNEPQKNLQRGSSSERRCARLTPRRKERLMRGGAAPLADRATPLWLSATHVEGNPLRHAEVLAAFASERLEPARVRSQIPRVLDRHLEPTTGVHGQRDARLGTN